MRQILVPTLLSLTALALVSCGRVDPPQPPAQSPPPAVSDGGPAPLRGPDPSLPRAADVVPQAPAASTAGSQTGRSTGALSPAQESAGMPLPGQNNDHSAPLGTPPRAASSP